MNKETPELALQDVRHMAKLSRLKLSGEEEKIFSRQFMDILGHMAVLQNVFTKDIEPLYSPMQEFENTRKDKNINIRTQAQILSNAPETDGEYFIVPRIV